MVGPKADKSTENGWKGRQQGQCEGLHARRTNQWARTLHQSRFKLFFFTIPNSGDVRLVFAGAVLPDDRRHSTLALDISQGENFEELRI